jgi:hypothetical protein
VDGDCFSFADPNGQQAGKGRRFAHGLWHPPVRDGEGNELDCMLATEMGFPLQAEFMDLFRFEEADDDVDTFQSPAGNLVVEPIASAGRAMIARRPAVGVSIQ